MKSNKFFSLNRFYLLLRNDMFLNYKKYLLTIAGAFVIGFIFLYILMPKIELLGENYLLFDRSKYENAFIICLMGLGAFVGSAFSELSSKSKTSNYLLMPASTFEKFLGQFVIRIILGTTIFLFIFWVDAHLARIVALSQIEGPNHEPPSANASKCISAFHYSMFLVKDEYPVLTNWKFVDGMAFILSIFSIGMYMFSVKIFFKKMGLVKTIISLVVISYFIFGSMMLLLRIFYPGAIDVSFNNIMYVLANGYNNMSIWMFSLVYCASLFLIPLGYFKLKEKEV